MLLWIILLFFIVWFLYSLSNKKERDCDTKKKPNGWWFPEVNGLSEF